MEDIKKKILEIYFNEPQTDEETLNAVAEYIQGLLDEKWILVDEELPERTGYYLIYDPNGFGSDKRTTARFDDYNSQWYLGIDTVHPTHWMNLPQSPKVK